MGNDIRYKVTACQQVLFNKEDHYYLAKEKHRVKTLALSNFIE